jgi:hypothetical protein
VKRILLVLSLALVVAAMMLATALPAFAVPGKAQAGERELPAKACETGQAEDHAPVVGVTLPPEEECSVYPDRGPGRGF